jgi:hypothetical protein
MTVYIDHKNLKKSIPFNPNDELSKSKIISTSAGSKPTIFTQFELQSIPSTSIPSIAEWFLPIFFPLPIFSPSPSNLWPLYATQVN